MKIKKEKREIEKSKERIESFNKACKKSWFAGRKMRYIKLAMRKIKHLLCQCKLIACRQRHENSSGREKIKHRKTTYERFKASEEERRSECTDVVLVGSSVDQLSSGDESFHLATSTT